LAADLGPAPSYKAPAIAPQYDWTGFYLGAHATYSWLHGHGETENTATGQEFPGSSDTSAPHFGGQIGYDYELVFVLDWLKHRYLTEMEAIANERSQQRPPADTCTH
jgi:hypothetical protein